MKNILLTLTFITLLSFIGNAQKITIKKSWGSNICSIDGKKLKMSELVTLMKENTQNFKLISKAKKNYTAASIFGAAGGALVGWPIGTSVGGGEPNWTLAGIGAGLIAISLPFNSKYNKSVKDAVDLYNSATNKTSHYEFQPRFQLNTSSNGIGVSLVF